MKTEILDFKDERLITLIQKGEVVSFPTETVYGLGVIYDNEASFEKMIEVKKRRPDKPFTLMLSSPQEIDKYAIINEKTRRVVEKFMPGEITILVKPKEDLYPWVRLNSKYIGIRVSGSKKVCDMIERVGKPMLVTSANISSFPCATNFQDSYRTFNQLIKAIVDGPTSSSTPSTIVICDEELSLVRLGSIKFEDIQKVWED